VRYFMIAAPQSLEHRWALQCLSGLSVSWFPIETLATRSLNIEQDKEKNWHVVERSYGSFGRAIPLPFDPDPAKVEAKFDKGVLHIHLPKPAEVAQKQQKIEIKKG
jgi:Hsp20/alpha crystallin family